MVNKVLCVFRVELAQATPAEFLWAPSRLASTTPEEDHYHVIAVPLTPPANMEESSRWPTNYLAEDN